ncbi:MAG TPA: FtsX-like permease family protein [Dokdonella sp.]|uniref:ABC transporter permease n=1 Tax=Dokdonella sp. TaxID=2291710 RepID=UPI002CF636A6|nr:FtsX-like permease family protein [Dokdonella sp.]HUD43108.1 FtsX-like permease family protein [Dokdonella sp.]
MEIRPILSALMRSKVSMILIGLQVALTLAIVCNALFIIGQRLDLMKRPSGMNEADTFSISSIGFGQGFDVQSAISADLNLLRSLPGVAAATTTNAFPLSNSGWSSGLSLAPGQRTSTANTAFYFVDESGVSAYGAELVAGRDFKAEEIGFRTPNDEAMPRVAIMTRALAKQMFPDVADPVGQTFYFGGDDESEPATVIGIIDRLQAPWVSASMVENTLLLPSVLSGGSSSTYLVRAEPGRRDEVMKEVEDKLATANRSRILRGLRSTEERRSQVYAEDRAMTIILGSVIVALLGITALGIVGMASFWVAQRTRQIGTRRALGATRGDILRYFQTENFIITTVGLIAGGILAYAFSLWLMDRYQAPRLPWHYVPIGFVCLWALGQLAVLGPALRASRVPPAVATRSV